MSENNMMEGLRQFLRTYPPLSEDKLHIDFLPERAKSYAVEIVPAQDVLRTYVDGTTWRQVVFTLASREYYGAEVRQQLNNLGFYEAFSGWLKAQTKAKNLPDLGEGRQVLWIGATTPGYAFAADEDKARYQIQCRLEFLQRSE